MTAKALGMLVYRWPQLAIGRFVARRTMRSAAMWALIFGVYVGSKAAGYAAAYPTLKERLSITAALGHNVGLSALLGVPHHMETVAGFTTWNTLGVMTIVGSIWAFLLATKTLRGEEQNGRVELLLTGQTTMRRATLNTLGGLGVSLGVLYVIAAITFAVVGHLPKVGFGLSAAGFLALCVVAGAAVFMAVGALASQLMPTRARAAGLAAAVFGVCFVLRAIADTTSLHWLSAITPLGWIERLQPLYASQAVWLIPTGLFVTLLSTLSIYLSGRRDLGESTFADKTTARPHVGLLGSPLGLAVRLTRVSTVMWLAVIGLVGLMFGALTKSALQAFDASNSAQHILGQLAHNVQQAGATTFLSISFLMLMTLLMAYAANAAGAAREDEAGGQLDNFLVRPVGRLAWLWRRIALATAVIVLGGVLAGCGSWLGQASQHLGLSFSGLFGAGVNIIAPALLVLGIGVCMLGWLPRFVTLVSYAAIAWSFLLEMLSSGLKLSHWLLDTSILHHVALAPASPVSWKVNGIMAGLGLVLAIAGALRFRTRDLQVE